MGRRELLRPEYHEHKATGRAVWWENGKRREQLLPGPFGSAESRAAFGRLLLEQEGAPKGATVPPRDGLRVVELLDAYFTHAQRHYRKPDGRPTSELDEVKLVVRAVRELSGQEMATEFGPLKLKAVRQGWGIAKLSRLGVNRRTNIARRIFKWAAGQREHRWRPNQLRHTCATAVRKAHGLEAVQVLSGHSRADVMQIDAEKNQDLAAEIVGKIG